MKITDLQLQQYGIYHDASWQPSQTSLNIVMGENESGKTTMLRFIRDMLFGYGRGKWQGRKGNMGFVRSDGQFYRVFRNEKEQWFENANHVKFTEDLPAAWWHGLNRSIYEKIFAVGLEDLQGASFLANDTVRSRFFMLQGGDKLANAKAELEEAKGKLFTSSAQGKRKSTSWLLTWKKRKKNWMAFPDRKRIFRPPAPAGGNEKGNRRPAVKAGQR